MWGRAKCSHVASSARPNYNGGQVDTVENKLPLETRSDSILSLLNTVGNTDTVGSRLPLDIILTEYRWKPVGNAVRLDIIK